MIFGRHKQDRNASVSYRHIAKNRPARFVGFLPNSDDSVRNRDGEAVGESAGGSISCAIAKKSDAGSDAVCTGLLEIL